MTQPRDWLTSGRASGGQPGARWRGVRRCAERVELGAEHVDLGLELGDGDDRLGGAGLGVVATALGASSARPTARRRRRDGPPGRRLRVCSAAFFWADERATLEDVDGLLALGRSCARMSAAKAADSAVRRSVRARYSWAWAARSCAASRRACISSEWVIRVAAAPATHGEDGSDGGEAGGRGRQGADHERGGDGEQGDGDDQAGAALATASRRTGRL